MPNAYQLFADVLDYPRPSIAEATRQCVAMMEAECPEAAEKLKVFEVASTALDLASVQELYTESFDLQPDCTLNASYHLFGDDWRRSMFLAELKGIYDCNSFQAGNELPDHLCLVLRFIASQEPGEQTDELAQECVVPAIRRMLSTLKPGDNPYKHALEALLVWLRPSRGALVSYPAEIAPSAMPEELS